MYLSDDKQADIIDAFNSEYSRQSAHSHSLIRVLILA